LKEDATVFLHGATYNISIPPNHLHTIEEEHITISELKFADKLVLHTDTGNWSRDISADQAEYLGNQPSPVI